MVLDLIFSEESGKNGFVIMMAVVSVVIFIFANTSSGNNKKL
jgi:hypothetical protein